MLCCAVVFVLCFEPGVLARVWVGRWELFWRSWLLLGFILRFEFWDSAQVERFWGSSHFGCKFCAEIK